MKVFVLKCFADLDHAIRSEVEQDDSIAILRPHPQLSSQTFEPQIKLVYKFSNAAAATMVISIAELVRDAFIAENAMTPYSRNSYLNSSYRLFIVVYNYKWWKPLVRDWLALVRILQASHGCEI